MFEIRGASLPPPMTKEVFALVALCSFAFGFVAVWYFLG